MTDKKVKYVKHPVSAKEKVKLRKAGFTIVDARFDPNPKPVTPVITEPPAIADDNQATL